MSDRTVAPLSKGSPRASTAGKKSLRVDIQGLRAVAVSAVVAYHAGVGFTHGGFVGVDIFFVISGFLITHQLFGFLSGGSRFSLARFYAQRARRLLPMSVLVASVTVLASWWWFDSIRASKVSTDALWTGIFALNIRLADQGVQYMGSQAEPSPLQHYWSLAVEEQFYLVWPLLLLALTVTWWRRGAGRQRSADAIPWAAVVVLGAAVLASYLWCIQQTEQARDLAYFLTPARAWELGVGALVALTLPLWRRMPTALAALTGVLGLVGLLGAVAFIDEQRFPGAIAAWPVVATAAVLVAGARGRSVLDPVFAPGPVQWLGGVSYSWYLWHWPVLIFLPEVLGHAPSAVDTAVAVGFSLWVAGLSQLVLEDPVRFLPALAPPARSGGLALGATGVLMLATFGAPQLAPQRATFGAAAAEVTFSDSRDLDLALSGARTATKVPANLDPTLEKLANDRPYVDWPGGSTCMVGLEVVELPADCRVNAKGGLPVVLAGDSHAYQWMPAIRQIAGRRGWTLYNLTKSGCPLYDATVYSTDLGREYTECDRWRERALDRIESIEPAMVITSAFVGSDRGKRYAEQWNRGVTETVLRLRAHGAKVVSISDTPWPNTAMDSCLAENPDDWRECAPARVQSYRDSERAEQTGRRAAAAGAVVIDPTDWFCKGDVCPAVVGNTPVYNDETHMSATWASQLTDVLARRIPAARQTPATPSRKDSSS